MGETFNAMMTPDERKTMRRVHTDRLLRNAANVNELAARWLDYQLSQGYRPSPKELAALAEALSISDSIISFSPREDE